jgi:exodeoxyribonuclease III
VLEWIAAERPDVLCLQELKASIDQLPFDLRDIDGYWAYYHGDKGYSGVGLLVAKALSPEAPLFSHPSFDFEHRIACTTITSDGGHLGGGNPSGLPVTIASVYVPNGGKDYDAKLRFLDGLDTWAESAARAGQPLVICGDLNVARTDRDIHPKERKPNQIGARPDERALLEQVISRGLVDVGRTLDPDNDNLFTWWPPWRSMKERNIGWRIDYVLASAGVATAARAAAVQRETGTSDHAPVVVTFE